MQTHIFRIYIFEHENIKEIKISRQRWPLLQTNTVLVDTEALLSSLNLWSSKNMKQHSQRLVTATLSSMVQSQKFTLLEYYQYWTTLGFLKTAWNLAWCLGDVCLVLAGRFHMWTWHRELDYLPSLRYIKDFALLITH